MSLKERISLQRWITNFIVTHSLLFEELWKYMKNDPDVKKEIP